MLGKINILDELTANQIAAGEVVERPASVVKELVENSVDAGSTVIEVDIQEGGTKSIIITDNGQGMTKDDAPLAFQRHATSKIRAAEDLNVIRTLGFRGEALPSIASVAEVEMTTRPGEEMAGTQIVVKGSEIITNKETGRPAGTTVRVTELFFNTPARLKHMKGATVEGGHCGDVVTRLALAHPEVSFRFRHNEREVFHTPGRGDLRDTIAALFGVQFTREMLPVSGGNSALTFQGFLGKPSVSRANRHHQYILINGRYIRSRLISDAVEKGYHTMLLTGRRPVFVLAFEVDPQLVDVNIHPTKLEVRFQEEKELAALLSAAVRDALLQQTLIPQDGQIKLPADFPAGQRRLGTGAAVREEVQEEKFTQDHLEFRPSRGREVAAVGNITVGEVATVYQPIIPQAAEGENILPRGVEIPGGFPDLFPLGQIDNTYIAAGGNDGLYLVDQHAAHERVLYEELLDRFGTAGYIQELLLPVNLQLNHQDAQQLLANIITFTELGFIIEHFGGDSFLLRGVPGVIKKGQEKKIFLDLLDYFSLYQHKITGRELREQLIITMACKAAIKANQRLGPEEMTALLKSLAAARAPYTCPHGRPTVVHMTNYELQKKFKRVL